MKKIYIILACLIIFVGCSKKDAKINTQEKSTEAKVDVIKDDKEKIDDRGIDSDIDGLNVEIKQEAKSEYPFTDSIDDLLKESDAVIYATVLTKEKTEVETKGDLPKTVVKVKVNDILKGEELPNNLDINVYGGTVKLKEYKESNFNESNEKMGLNNLSAEELDSKYISVYPTEYTELKKDTNYIIFLYKERNRKNNNQEYYVTMSGYSIFEEKDDKFHNDQNGKVINRAEILDKIK